MAVHEGDVIHIPVANLEQQRAVPVDVVWSEDLVAHEEKYIQTTFTIIGTQDGRPTGPETEGIIFVQLSMIDDFKNKHLMIDSEITIMVDRDFQFGQKSSDGTGRWLVYHNKKNTPFQHRFVSATIQGAVDKAAGIAKLLGFASGESLIKDVAKLFGHHLHPFTNS